MLNGHLRENDSFNTSRFHLDPINNRSVEDIYASIDLIRDVKLGLLDEIIDQAILIM